MCTGGVVTLANENVSIRSVRMRNVRESVRVGCLRIFTNSDFAGNGVRLHALSQPNQAVRNDGHQVADGRSKKLPRLEHTTVRRATGRSKSSEAYRRSAAIECQQQRPQSWYAFRARSSMSLKLSLRDHQPKPDFGGATGRSHKKDAMCV